MMSSQHGRIAIVYPGDRDVRRSATPENNRFAQLFLALAAQGVHAEPAVYHDEFCEEVREQLLQADIVLVWVNPIEDGRDRSRLDAMLRDVARAGVFVSAHPDIILKIGTKEVLYRTRDIGWGSDAHQYDTLDQMRDELPMRLASGKARVLKQYRGHSGIGVWKVEHAGVSAAAGSKEQNLFTPQSDNLLRVRHAMRGCIEEEITLRDFLMRCEPYFETGPMIDQAYQDRITEGMVRCYLVGHQVAGFGLQAINALFPAPSGVSPTEAPQPGPRLYHPPTLLAFQSLKRQLEQVWVPALQRQLEIDTESLPVLWDCDFLLGPRKDDGQDTYVLCEINVSSVAPFPESTVPYMTEAVVVRLRSRSKRSF